MRLRIAEMSASSMQWKATVGDQDNEREVSFWYVNIFSAAGGCGERSLRILPKVQSSVLTM